MYIQLICAKDVTISTQEPLGYASIRRVVNFNRSSQTYLNQVTDKNVEMAFLKEKSENILVIS